MNNPKLLFHLFILSTTLNLTHGLRILGLFPFQAKSHHTMCEALMRGLAAKGHQVDVYSHFPLNKPVTNYRDISLAGTAPVMVNNWTFDTASIPSSHQMLQWLLITFGKSSCDLMGLPLFQDLYHNPPNDPPYDLVITELSVANCHIAWGRHLNIPVIGVVTPPLLDWQHVPLGVPYHLAVEPCIMSPYNAPMTFLERLNNLITYHLIGYTFAAYSRDQDEAVEKYFGPGLPNQVDLMKDLALVLVNHDVTISGIKSFPPLVVPVGGLHVVDQNDTLPGVVQKWLDDSKDGCVYFSFGSMTRLETFPKPFLAELYRAFENIKPVRVLLKIAKPEELPAGLPKNVLTQPWLNQIQVLKHPNVKAFVTHGGLMGTQESIYYGVPMIGIPLFTDQHFNVAAYAKRNIAVQLKLNEVTEESFTRAVHEILHNPIYSNAMKRASAQFKDRPMTAMDTSVFWVEYVSRHGKDALKSPVVDMPWWQASLLDVYAFIGLFTLVSVYILVAILKRFITWARLGVKRAPKRREAE